LSSNKIRDELRLLRCPKCALSNGGQLWRMVYPGYVRRVIAAPPGSPEPHVAVTLACDVCGGNGAVHPGQVGLP